MDEEGVQKDTLQGFRRKRQSTKKNKVVQNTTSRTKVQLVGSKESGKIIKNGRKKEPNVVANIEH